MSDFTDDLAKRLTGERGMTFDQVSRAIANAISSEVEYQVRNGAEVEFAVYDVIRRNLNRVRKYRARINELETELSELKRKNPRRFQGRDKWGDGQSKGTNSFRSHTTGAEVW